MGAIVVSIFVTVVAIVGVVYFNNEKKETIKREKRENKEELILSLDEDMLKRLHEAAELAGEDINDFVERILWKAVKKEMNQKNNMV